MMQGRILPDEFVAPYLNEISRIAGEQRTSSLSRFDGINDTDVTGDFLAKEGDPRMNTAVTVHPKLSHYGLITADLDAMTEWYGKVLGMTVNHRSKIPAIARLTHQGPPVFRFWVRQQ